MTTTLLSPLGEIKNYLIISKKRKHMNLCSGSWNISSLSLFCFNLTLCAINEANTQGWRQVLWGWKLIQFKENFLRKRIQKYLTFTVFFFFFMQKHVARWTYCPSKSDPWSLNFIGFMVKSISTGTILK